MEDKILKVKCFNVLKEIREIIENNNSEDELVKKHEYNHAIDVYQWLSLLHPEKDISFQIAALGHDIERCIQDKTIRSKNFESHKSFKEAHAKNSAEILREIMQKNNLPNEIVNKTVDLVKKHEFGGDEDSEIIKNLDSLGNIIWCERVLEKFAHEKISGTMRRMIDKLSEENKDLIRHLNLKTKSFWRLEDEIRNN